MYVCLYAYLFAEIDTPPELRGVEIAVKLARRSLKARNGVARVALVDPTTLGPSHLAACLRNTK